MKNRNITHSEKVKIIKDCLANELSYKETAKKFRIPHHNIYSWVQKYKKHGPMENYWGIIQEEMYRLTTYNTFEALEKDIKAYIKFYNTKRVTLKMGLKIPA